MRWTLLDSGSERTYAVVFDKGDEVMAGLEKFARDQNLDAAHLTAIGAFSRATLGYFDRERKDYDKIPIEEQVELLSLIGDVATFRGEPKVHAHVVVGRRDGTTRGGHLLEAHVWPTTEVTVVEAPRHLRRVYDPETGLSLINPNAT